MISFDNLLAASKICRLESNVDIYVRITPYTSLDHRIYMWYQNTFFYTKWYTVTVLCIGRNCKWNAHYLCLIASFHLAVGSNQYLAKKYCSTKHILTWNTIYHTELPGYQYRRAKLKIGVVIHPCYFSFIYNINANTSSWLHRMTCSDMAQGNDRDNKSNTEKKKKKHSEGRHIEFIFTNIGCYHGHHLKT